MYEIVNTQLIQYIDNIHGLAFIDVFLFQILFSI